MKGLKKVALASAIAAVSAGAQAELKALDDSAMGELTGQAGLTIDVETRYTIGEFAYHDTDGGFVLIQDIALGGNSNEGTSDMLDNFRMTIDVAGAGEALTYGFSEVRGLAQLHAFAGNSDAGLLLAAGGTDIDTTLGIDDAKTFGDGDLVIHFGFTDAWQKGGGLAAFLNSTGSEVNAGAPGTLSLSNVTWEQARDVALAAVDYQFDIGALGIASSTYDVNSPADLEKASATLYDASGNRVGLDTLLTDATSDTTTLLSDISFKGYLGPEDLHIENNGNGFGGTLGFGDANSKITWSSYFNVTDLDLYIDIAGVKLEDITINNQRGDKSGIANNQVFGESTGNSSFGFAHSIRQIYAVNEAVIHAEELAVGGNGYTDGVAINTHFKGDITIGALKFGDDDRSIGTIYLTDVESITNWTISAH